MALRIDGAQDDGNGLVVLSVDANGVVSASPASDGTGVESAQTLAEALADGDTITAVNGKLVATGGGGGGGGAQVVGGSIIFDTDGSGDPQTYSADVLGRVLPTGITNKGAAIHRAGLIIPAAGTVSNLRVKCKNVVSGSLSNQSWHVTVYKNGSASTLTLTGNDDGGVKDSTHVISVAEFDDIQLFITFTGTDGSTDPQTDVNITASFEYTRS